MSLPLFESRLTPEELERATELVAATRPPERLERYCERWSALCFDQRCKEPIAWGYVLAPWTPSELEPLFESAGTKVYLGELRSGLETVRISRPRARELYGPYALDRYEPTPGGQLRWAGVRFGDSEFVDPSLAPLGEEDELARADWQERFEQERREAEQRRLKATREAHAGAARRTHERAERAERACGLLGGKPDKPSGFDDVLGPFEPCLFDPWCGETVGWGFQIRRRVSSERWHTLGQHGDLVSISRSPAPYDGNWHPVVRELSRDVATAIYGPHRDEHVGPRGGWKGVTFGSTRFVSRALRPEPAA